MIRWIALGIDVSPFLGVSVRPYYLYSVCNKRVESFGVVVYVAKHDLGISLKVLLQINQTHMTASNRNDGNLLSLKKFVFVQQCQSFVNIRMGL